MAEAITWVGIDAHKKTLQICVLRGQERWEFGISNDAKRVRKMVQKLVRHAPGEVRCCYEAGPCGYALKRELEGAAPELVCEVVAPSLIPIKPGDRVKTDRRDARKLAEYLAGGLLTEVRPPSEEQEAVRDLVRCRRALKADHVRSRHRMSKLLLRRGIRYEVGKTEWTGRYREWLKTVRFDNPVDQTVFDQYLLGIEQLDERIANLDAEILGISESEPYREPVGLLRCFRGIDTLVAMTIITEVHDFRRFNSPLQLMSYLGLTPSETSSGDNPKRGPITKTGNSHARRVLVEASWCYRHRPAVGKNLRLRRQGQPAWAIAIADKAQQRLSGRYRRMLAQGKCTQKAVTAVARELAGFLWAVMREGAVRQHEQPETTGHRAPVSTHAHCQSPRAVTGLAQALPTGSVAPPVKGEAVARRTYGQRAKPAPARTPADTPTAVGRQTKRARKAG